MRTEIVRPQSRLEYIHNLELATPTDAFLKFFEEPRPKTDMDKGEGYVNASSNVSFVSGIPKQQQQDVLNSTLLAQLAANKKYDRENDTTQWYTYYRNVLENVGWVVSAFAFQHYESTKASFSMDKVALSIIEAIATGSELEVLRATLSALESQDPDSKAVTIFQNNSTSGQDGNFQLGTAAADSSGNVGMCLGAYYFKASKFEGNFLFWHWESKNIEFYTSAQKIVLNEQIYDTVRYPIITKLGDRAQTFVAQLDI